MSTPGDSPLSTIPRDLTAGVVVFLVALPLCLGVALASNSPLISGLIAGVVGGILVGLLSGSQSSVSGPAAGLTAVVAAQIPSLGSFPAFLLAVVLAGVIQIVMGLLRAGFLAAFFPSSVIKGLLAAIGVILILKQLPYVLGYDVNAGRPAGLSEAVRNLHPGAAVIGGLSVAVLLLWDRVKGLKKSPVPSALVVVLTGVGLSLLFRRFGDGWAFGQAHLVSVPLANSPTDFLSFLQLPDFAQWRNPKIYLAAATIAIVASLETLLNLQAVDKIDPRRRTSPPSRELWAQGVGNVVSGLAGGLPVTSVIVRSSVNLNAGGRTKLSAVFHGVLLLVCVLFLAEVLNLIPLSCLAAILLVTGLKLASPALLRQMWAEGRYQFAPFAITVAAIVLTDLLVGVVIGLLVSMSFILWSNARRPIRKIVETHIGGTVVRIELANQVSFLNRAAFSRTLDELPPDGHVVIDASHTDYIDPDVLDLIRNFKTETGPARGVKVRLVGFKASYEMQDDTQHVDYTTREHPSSLTPAQVLEILVSGHERAQLGHPLARPVGPRESDRPGPSRPIAVVLSCADAGTPPEWIFDASDGDILAVQVVGPVLSRSVLGSLEYGCAIAGAKLIVVLGHLGCRAVSVAANSTAGDFPGELGRAVESFRRAHERTHPKNSHPLSAAEMSALLDDSARRHVADLVDAIPGESPKLLELVRDGRVSLVGAVYDGATGRLEILRGGQ